MTNVDKVLNIARAEIGYREQAGHKTKFGAWYGMDGVPWCVIFQQWVFAQAGLSLPKKSASCSELLNWYIQNQPECVVKAPEPGCLIIFDLPNTGVATDHIGLCESVGADTVTTIDGNTSGASDANGGCVNRRTRAKKYVFAVIRPHELAESDLPKMTGKEIHLAQADYLSKQKLPDMMEAEYADAILHGITDGLNPCQLAPRYQVAAMVNRSYNALLAEINALRAEVLELKRGGRI